MPANAWGQEIGASLDSWAAPPPPARTAIDGRWCRLEPLDVRRHAAELFAAHAAAADARDWTYLPHERPADAEAFRVLVAAQALSRDPLHFAILDAGRAVGSAALMRIDPANGVIEVGHIAFSPSLKATRAGTEAIFLLMRVAFELGYRRLEWKCDSLNAPSRRAALRYGFTFEGIFRQAVVTKGRSRDTAWYAIVDGDWPAVRVALEAWLDPANFDEAGRQRRPLAARGKAEAGAAFSHADDGRDRGLPSGPVEEEIMMSAKAGLPSDSEDGGLTPRADASAPNDADGGGTTAQRDRDGQNDTAVAPPGERVDDEHENDDDKTLKRQE